jgi:hypothetical protein
VSATGCPTTRELEDLRRHGFAVAYRMLGSVADAEAADPRRREDRPLHADAVWERAERQFDAGELGHLLIAIAAINFWNRVAVSTRVLPRSFEHEQAA